MASCPWRLDLSEISKRTYRRLLGKTELGFYWDTVCGIAITLEHLELEFEVDNETILSKENIKNAWIALKRRYPLISSRVEKLPHSEDVEFVIDEDRLDTARLGEINIKEAESAEDVTELIDYLLNGPPSVNSDRTAQLWIINRKDICRRFHVLLAVAHYATDGMASATLVKYLCQELSSPSGCIDKNMDIRLRTLLPLEDLYPSISLSRQRWRRAIASVIYDKRQLRRTGGHTLPINLSPKKIGYPGWARTLNMNIPVDMSTGILATCRKMGITFGNALPVLCQIAHSRILHRLHQEGKINEDEWQYRMIQPMHFAGPLNLRPYLDKNWYKHQGGAGEVCLAISFFEYTLPFMPSTKVPPKQWTDNRMPSFDSLLSQKRFVLRSCMIQRQSRNLLKHPLFLEFHSLRGPKRIERARNLALDWQRERNTEIRGGVNIPSSSTASVNCVYSNGGSSLGNRDGLYPYEYPFLDNPCSTRQPTKLRIVRNSTSLRVRPGELYLGAEMKRGQLGFFVFYDGNVYEEELVKDWTEEVKRATIYYLGNIASIPATCKARL